MLDVLSLTKSLIACPSVTPEDAGAQALLAEVLEGLGFECHHLPFGEGAARVPNLFARLGTGGPHLCFAGHTDVVPPGPEERWTYGPFNPHVEDGVLFGRGASDMKGAVAAYVSSVAAFVERHGVPGGSISLLITGDEEADAINGTVKVLEWMEEHGHVPDVALVGEPTNPDHLGQEIKIGRRGSLTCYLTVNGKQGHVAYPHRADNPVPRMVKMLDALSSYSFDEGTEFFAPTNLEITTVDVGNTADNVIPAQVKAMFNLRFSDAWSSATLIEKIHEILKGVGGTYEIDFRRGAESFMTQPGPWPDIVQKAVHDVSGKTPDFTTTGGTSDARFIQKYCPVIECGAVNASVHQIDEHARVEHLEQLHQVYVRVLERYFGA